MSNLQGKRLLFLGGAVQCCKVVEAAKRLGVYTIVTDIKASRPMCEIADEILPYSVKDVEGIADWCSNNHVDGNSYAENSDFHAMELQNRYLL